MDPSGGLGEDLNVGVKSSGLGLHTRPEQLPNFEEVM